MVFHRGRRNEQPTPIPLACFIIAEVCAALHYAHERRDARGELLGLVHRDVSLQNVLISYEGAVKLTDFGIAMSAENRARTEVGIVKGKFGYMSPEQIRGELMDRRSDVFATGICLYELLTGERLFSGDSDYAAVEKVRNVSVEPPSRKNRAIPSSLEVIVMKALAKHPRDRFQTAGDFRRALLEFMAESRNERVAGRTVGVHAQCVRRRAAGAAHTRAAAARPRASRAARRGADRPCGLRQPRSGQHGVVARARCTRASSTGSGLNARPEEPGSAAPSVPPLVPRPESVPAPAPSSAIYALEHAPPPPAVPAEAVDGNAALASPGHPGVRIGLDWDEDDERTATAGLEGEQDFERRRGHAPDPRGRDLLGRERARRFRSAAVARAGRAVARRRAHRSLRSCCPISPPNGRRAPALRRAHPAPETSYAMVVVIVVGIIGLIAGALWATQGTRKAEVRFSTEPADAQVFVDGQRRRGEPPLVILSDLAPRKRT